MNIIDSIQSVYSGFRFEWGCIIAILCFALYILYAIKAKRKKSYIRALAFAAYIVLLLGGTLINRTSGDEYRIKWFPFWSYWETFVMHNGELWRQMIYNVAVFVPWGFLFPILFEGMQKLRRNILGAATVSVGIELIQLLFKIGLFELDDVIHNTLGAVIGYGIWMLGYKVWEMYIKGIEDNEGSKISNSDN